MSKETMIYWTRFTWNDWRLYTAATSKGLCFIGSNHGNFEELVQWAGKAMPEYRLVRDDEKLASYTAELSEYIKNGRAVFSVPLDLYGTEFQLAVWKALMDIPYGETYSYSDIAEMIRKPSAVRAVGAAIGKNPVLITVPCHRVIGKNGKLTGFRGGLEMKKQLLALEGRHNKTWK
ncbi:methylated-DNA--[protein]-cysteine S-methyltransferase [Bacillus siamensis]|uniref:methylated-DNA--[protein]-cysteine S-methyltransferase n=1 Tax=Bacillus siamensis TaxID=659243 RepID=UPI0005F934EE|nr:methylated-DNA--[protein]-cysteine S-methyltransferase [Bacillus siamensis]MED0770476.1 methylated-DNA--[protein]-cysteine S-methyltransferase [Bacillus siamensis]MED0775033.1 methylated-DNA--[protein]-cysteine S-methyltransferase [Bacillus siamensis]MED0779967.1 methylated-DNA--[protein]-cysteine S-methyltransferase [Bacillus siamensis]MED0834553.1 methylated-DNA--[protein]-cysteine S-methyltransferase [Bacillus siamensis]PIK32441.1 methylated-DNA--[protein]-cysteine S-methyltransferase [B